MLGAWGLQLVFKMTPKIGSLALLLLKKNFIFYDSTFFSDSNGTANLILRVNKKGKIQSRMGIVLKIGTLITMSLGLFCKFKMCIVYTIYVNLEEEKNLYTILVYTHKSIPVHYSTYNEI